MMENSKILIIDDALFARSVLKRSLSAGNYNNIIEAGNAEEGKAIFAREHPDLTMLDISLPDNDDLSLLTELLEMAPDAKIVMCSAMGQNSIMRRSIELGAKDFVVKPYTEKLLLEVVNKQLQP